MLSSLKLYILQFLSDNKTATTNSPLGLFRLKTTDLYVSATLVKPARHEKLDNPFFSSKKPQSTKNLLLFKIHLTQNILAHSLLAAARGEPTGATGNQPLKPQAPQLEPISSLEQYTLTQSFIRVISQAHLQSVTHSGTTAERGEEIHSMHRGDGST